MSKENQVIEAYKQIIEEQSNLIETLNSLISTLTYELEMSIIGKASAPLSKGEKK